MAKASVWESPSRYGTYKGERGSPMQWRAAYEEARYSREKAMGILADSPDTPHRILGVKADASQREIKAAWRRLVLLHHPDKGGDRVKFEQVMAAYSLLEA